MLQILRSKTRSSINKKKKMIHQTSSDSIAFTLQKILLETENYRLGENNCKLRYVAEDLKIHKLNRKKPNTLYKL